MKFEPFNNIMKEGIVSVFFLGLIVYSGLIAVFALKQDWAPKFMTEAENGMHVFGLPICAIAAFAIVCVLEKFAPATRNEEGKLEFKALGLTFSGPAGPASLWVVCYLNISSINENCAALSHADFQAPFVSASMSLDS